MTIRLWLYWRGTGLLCDGCDECAHGSSHGSSHYGAGCRVNATRTGITRRDGSYHLYRTGIVLHYIHAVGSAIGNAVDSNGRPQRCRAAVGGSHHVLSHLLTDTVIAEAAAKLNCLVIFHPVYYHFQISRIYVVIFLHMSLFFCTFIA